MRLGSLSQKCFESNTKYGKRDKKGHCNNAAFFGQGGRFGMAAACALAIIRGNTVYISRLSRPAGRSKRIFTGGDVEGNGICCKNLRFASYKKGLLRGAAAPEGYVIAAQTSKSGSSFSIWMLDIKALCSGSVNSASFTYLFSAAAVRTGSAMVPAPPMQPPGQPMPSSR